MNILHILATPSAGGAEMYVKDLSKSQVASGHGVSLGFLSRALDAGNSPAFESKYLKEIGDHGIKHFFIGNECRYNFLKGCRIIGKNAKADKIDIYHSHLFYGALFGAFLKSRRVYTHHNSIAKAPKMFFSLLNRTVDQYVGISEKCTELLGRYTGRSVVTIANGVDQNKLGRCQLPSASERFRFVAVGYLSQQKDYLTMLAAISALPERTKQLVHLSIVGEGTEKQNLTDYVVAHKLGDVVTLLGNRSDVPDLLAASHAFLMSSAWEGLPISLLEATLSGLPCIVTDVGGNSEVIRNCQNGICVPSKNPQKLAEAIEQLVTDKSLHSTFRKNAIEHGRVYSIEHSNRGHESLYESLLHGKHGRGT